MKDDPKPEKRNKARLFANSGEAIVFWLSLAGLVFLAIVSLFRYFYLKEIVSEYNSVAEKANPIIIQLEELKDENNSLRQEQESLRSTLRAMQDSTKLLKSDVSRLQAKPEKPPPSGRQSERDTIILPKLK